jgi:hypothetical protein
MKPDADTRIQIAKSLRKRRGIRTHSGIKEQTPWLFSELISRHCDEFFRSRGLSINDLEFNQFQHQQP